MGSVGGVLGDDLGTRRDQLLYDVLQAGRGFGEKWHLLMAFLHPFSSD